MNRSLTHSHTARTQPRKYLGRLLSVCLLMIMAMPAAFASPKAFNPAAEDVILQWNRVLAATVTTAGQQPASIVAARSYSMMHGAMFDAVNSIDGSYTPYLIDVPGSTNASLEAAAAKAAHDVLVALFPARASIYDAELQISLAGLPENRVRQGLKVGRETAAAMLDDRANDAWTASPPSFLLPPTPGNWQPTPPAFAGAAFTHYPNVKPFVLSSSEQFRPPPPPALSSAEYAAALNEVKAVGSATSTIRTPDQAIAAQAWASIGNPTGVSIFWNTIARSLATSRGLTTVENARLFAMINMSTHDALQTSFASKFHYGLWRPVTAIQRAGEDGNPATDPDTAWTPLIGTPPYPTYAGNMAAIGMANAGSDGTRIWP
jgi:hypothetical protein